MTIYLSFLSLFIISAFFDYSHKQLLFNKIVLFYLLTFSLSFIGLRYYTGADWSSYMKYFERVDWSNKKYGFGYKLLNIICKYIFNNYFAVQFFSTLVFILSIEKFVKQYSRYPFLTWFLIISLFFRNLFMCQVRQSLAISIILLGTHFLLKRKIFTYILFVFIATLFHTTALFGFLSIFFLIPLPKWIRIMLCLVGLIFVKYTNLPIALLGFIAEHFMGNAGKIAAKYINSAYFAKGGNVSSGTYFLANQMLNIIIVCLYKPKNRRDNFFINALVLYSVITACTLSFELFNRVAYYYEFYAIIGYTRLFDISIIKNNKNLYALILMLFLTFFTIPYVKAFDPNRKGYSGRPLNQQWIPYYNVFLHPDYANQRKDWNQ